MAEGRSLTAHEAVEGVLASEHADVLRESVAVMVREIMEAEVAPTIEDYWARDQFPHEIIPKLAALDVNIAGVGYEGYGAAGGSCR